MSDSSSERAIVSVIGLMSGTSIDGAVDAAHILTDGEGYVERQHHQSYEYETPLGPRPFHRFMKGLELAVREHHGDTVGAARDFDADPTRYVKARDGDLYTPQELLRLVPWWQPGTSLFAHLVKLSAETHAEAVLRLQKSMGREADRVSLIGYHGQTVYHAPHQRRTVQLGDPQLVADRCGLTVAFDFRLRDIEAGGQGAPLAPLYHAALARMRGVVPCAVVNIGGVSNITVVAERDQDLVAFDAGPGNILLDRFVSERGAGAFDRDGQAAAAGQVNQRALDALLEHGVRQGDGRYLEKPAPKSLDARDCHLIDELQKLSLEDGCRTLAAFSAEALARATHLVRARGRDVPARWVVCGGGARNPVILQELRTRLVAHGVPNAEVFEAEQLSWSSQAMEAELFAYLAVRVVRKLPLSFPGTTGVPAPTCGGQVVQPRRR